MGLPDEIHGVPVAEGYPGTHAQAIDPGAGTVPSRGGRSEAPPSPGLLVLYLPYAVAAIIRYIDIAG